MSAVAWRTDTLLRMETAVEKVRERLLRSTAVLESNRIPYCVIGGNAVAAWVSQVDPGAVRNTRDVDLLIRRRDLDQAIQAMSAEGWVHVQTSGIDLFLDREGGLPSEGIHLLFANEKVKTTDCLPTPDVEESRPGESYQVIELEPLIRMKLISYRRKDQVHLLDMIHVGLIDDSWPARYPPPLNERLQALLDDPNG